MSYNPNRYEDSLSELFSSMSDCVVFCKRMIARVDSPVDFLRWFDKAKLADPRTTYFFLKKNDDKLSEETRKITKPFMDKMSKNRPSDPIKKEG